MPDQAWVVSRIEQTCKGDLEAFGDLAEAFQSSLRGFIAMLGVPTAEVEDLAQETFLEAFKALKSFDTSQPFAPWLRGIARNLVLRYRTEAATALARQKQARIREFLLQKEIPSPVLEAEDCSYLEHLSECLKKLSGKAAVLVQQRYYQQRNSAEIAAKTNQQPSAVRVALGRVRAELRKCIERHMVAAETR